ncbi:unnamed protein product [Nezara viridula]|uniref:Neuropeptide n=1 Tax=Nezara viridula TaxID=85310 RepID=A0A9P0H9Q6_NEZVI|nr:unnamed protein product [Nezara viridula]
MLPSYLGLVLVVACLIGSSAGQGLFPEIDSSETHEENVTPLQIFKVPDRKQCPDGQQRLNGRCRTVFTNSPK